MRYVVGIILLTTMLGCTSAPAPLADGTARMVAILDSIATAQEANPRQNAYLNKARVAQLQHIEPPQNPVQRAQYLAQLGQEELRAGFNRDAIASFKTILDLIAESEEQPPLAFQLGIKDMLAISYMRLAEEENCLENHHIDRCLWPIQEGGVHTRTEGAKAAIRLYAELLEADPHDLNARWLLNVAYMTLGQYPDSVPAKWRIPLGKEASDFHRFKDVARSLGVATNGLSGGAIMEDFTGDGRLDLMASSWGLRDQVRLFVNNGNGTFNDQTEQAGLTGIVGGLNMVQADFNNDGFTDVFILRGAWLYDGHPNSLLRNNGDGTFSDVTVSAGLDAWHPTQTAAWGDFNNDGWIDLFIGNESSRRGGSHPCELYRNNGDGTFSNIADEAGVDMQLYAKGVVWGDYDNDGWLDLYISNWEGPNRLYRNKGSQDGDDWAFEDVTAVAGVGEPLESFPTWFWDYDNDGWLDLFVSGWRASSGDMAAEYLELPIQAAMPRLYHNQRDGTFADVTKQAGLNKVLYTMGSNFGDLDNDGWLDFYAGTGDPDFRSLMPNRMFRGVGGRHFEEVTAAGRFGHLQKGHGVAFGDLDNDGDQDIFAVMGGAFEGDVFDDVLFENPGFSAHWIILKLEGTISNRSAIGARIRVDIETPDGPRSIHRVVSSGGSFGASSLQQESGLGNATRIHQITIQWPASQTIQTFQDIAVDHAYRITEGQAAPESMKQGVISFTGQRHEIQAPH